MKTTKEKIQELASYDQCAHVPPLFFAQILESILVMSEPTELSELTTPGAALPKVAGAFIYNGYPCHMRCVEHNGNMYIIFCTFHNGTSGALGSNYILFKDDGSGQYKFTNIYSSTNVQDWVKRAFSEAIASATYPGIMSNTLFKRLDAVYDFCVSQGMAEIK